MAFRKESLESFALTTANRIEAESRMNGERLRTNNSVTLRKRVRNANDNDRLGVFSPITGAWTSDLNTNGIYSLNITTPTVRTNTSAMITANVKIDIQPRFIKDSTAQMAADVADAVIEQKNRLQWTTQLEELIALEQQIGPGVFIRVNHNPNVRRKHVVPEFEDQDVEMPGTAICSECGEETPVNGELDEMSVACGACGTMAVIEKMPTNVAVPVPTGLREFTTGDTQTKIIPFFEIRCDLGGTQGGDLTKAKWFEHHYIASLDELQVEYPEAADKIQGANTAGNMSYPLQWQQALKHGNIIPIDTSSATWVVEQREVRDIFLTPAMYLNVEMTSPFTLADDKGKERFSVEAGQTLADAKIEGKVPDEPLVLCFRMVGTTLIDVFPCDFREEFTYVTFMADPSTFWGLFLTDLSIMQDIVNQMLTLQMYHIKRNAITSIIYNSSAFDPDAFKKDLIPTADTLPPDVPIGNTFSIVPALRMSGEPMEMLQAVMAMKSDVTLTTPALMGQAQPNEPYHAQLLQRQSALGLLAPASISKATAKVHWAKQQLKLVQKYWTDEDTAEYLKLNGGWTDDHIEAFVNCDFDNDLLISYAQGSEIPQSQVEREVKLQKMLSDMMGLAQAMPELIKPEMLNEVFLELTQVSGLDIDFNNTESDNRLAEARYDKILEFVETAPEEVEIGGQMMPSSEPQVAQLAAQMFLSQPDMQPQIWEGHQTQVEYYADKLRNECAKEVPNNLLITVLNGIIMLHLQSQVKLGQLQTGMQMEIQAPAMQAQEQQQQQQMQLEAAKGEDEAAQADAEKQQAQADAQAQRDHELQLKTMDMAGRQAEREHKSSQESDERMTRLG